VKLLLDTCAWSGARHVLQEAGHDVIWAGDWPEDPGDEEILARAYRDGRTVVTLDKDFGELAIVHRMPHCGIVRLVGIAARRQGQACLHAIAQHGHQLRQGAIVTVEPGRMRIRPPEVL
jgi:predicted nuclease of predicted toxin-antitoxin system